MTSSDLPTLVQILMILEDIEFQLHMAHGIAGVWKHGKRTRRGRRMGEKVKETNKSEKN